MTVTISGKPYEYGTNEENSTGTYLNALYNAAKERGMTDTMQDIERLYWKLPENQKWWMRKLGFKPVEQKQTKAA
jgi:N-acetylglutamate synthase-like GNAT family acetyltransferase